MAFISYEVSLDQAFAHCPIFLTAATRRRIFKSVVKAYSLTVELPWILEILNLVEASGIYDVAVKCIDIIKNTYCEGS